MPALEDYLFSMEALPEDRIDAAGLAAVWCDASGVGTCGVTTSANGLALPLPVVSAGGSWPPLGLCRLPLPVAGGAIALWHPAWGGCGLPVLDVAGWASFPLRVDTALPPLFALAGAGARAGLEWPAGAVLAGAGAGAFMALPGWTTRAASGLDRRGAAVSDLPSLAARGLACGLESPVTSGIGSDAVVALLCQGDPDLAQAARTLAQGATDDDAVAGALLAGVAGGLAYVADGDPDVDVWTCALATYCRGSGDCEDGALLLHALLLAAGLPADRIVTAFGRVGLDRVGHAWVAWRRRSDGRWTALDWTLGPSQGPVAGLPVLGEAASYAVVDYALTAGAFFTVRQDAAVFFARSLAEGIVLPRATIAAEGSLGGRGNVGFPAGGLAGQGLSGAVGGCRFGRAGASGAAGSVWGQAAIPSLLADALAGALATAATPLALITGTGGNGGWAGMVLVRPQAVGAAVAAALVAGGLSLGRARLAATGLAGLVGGGTGRLPRPGLRLCGLPGGLATAGVTLPRPACLGDGGLGSLGHGLASVAGWTADSRGRAGGPGLGGYAYATTGGEEWT